MTSHVRHGAPFRGVDSPDSIDFRLVGFDHRERGLPRDPQELDSVQEEPRHGRGEDLPLCNERSQDFEKELDEILYPKKEIFIRRSNTLESKSSLQMPCTHSW